VIGYNNSVVAPHPVRGRRVAAAADMHEENYSPSPWLAARRKDGD